jgi:hypothetical protein
VSHRIWLSLSVVTFWTLYFLWFYATYFLVLSINKLVWNGWIASNSWGFLLVIVFLLQLSSFQYCCVLIFWFFFWFLGFLRPCLDIWFAVFFGWCWFAVWEKYCSMF